MHMNTKRILPWLTAALLMASACSIDNVRETDDSRNDGDYVDVCLSVQPQSELRTRATYNPSISQGKKVDMLIYAVYEVNRDKDKDNEIVDYKLLVQYGLGDLTEYGLENKGKTVGKGQTVLVPAFSGGKIDQQHEIKLRLMRNREYAVAFWAQHNDTKAFNTSDLRKVEVIYKDAKNNDELRDAFCKVEVFRAAAGLSQTVILQRPFAQINVGTTGADYYNHLSFANQNYQAGAPVKKSVLYSSITLTGVANFIDVVTDEISSIKTDNFDGTTATFAPAKIAAYWEVNPWDNVENKLSLNLGQLIGSDDPETANTTDSGPDPDAQYIFPSFVENEEFLMINLDDHGDSDKTYNKAHTTEDANLAGYLKYKTEYPTIDEEGVYLTETFKYLSMCYVLVPAAKVSDSDPEEEPAEKVSDPDSEKETSDPYRGSVINVSFKMGDNANLQDDDTKGLWCNEQITLTSVPVHRNWRTNILGGLYGKDKNYPDKDVEDPSSLFEKKYIEATIYVNPSYAGDYNRNGQEWSEQKNASTETK